jgi:hypothetical protein
MILKAGAEPSASQEPTDTGCVGAWPVREHRRGRRSRTPRKERSPNAEYRAIQRPNHTQRRHLGCATHPSRIDRREVVLLVWPPNPTSVSPAKLSETAVVIRGLMSNAVIDLAVRRHQDDSEKDQGLNEHMTPNAALVSIPVGSAGHEFAAGFYDPKMATFVLAASPLRSE